MVRRSRLKKVRSMLIKPRLRFSNVGGTVGVGMNPKRIYRAIVATNQPDYKEKGLVFVNLKQKAGTDFILLGKEDYLVVRKGSS